MPHKLLKPRPTLGATWHKPSIGTTWHKPSIGAMWHNLSYVTHGIT
jgi:hypothetical protein